MEPLRTTLAALLLLTWLPALAPAEPETSSPEEALEQFLGSPVRPGRARAALGILARREAEERRRLALVLGRAGGWGALEALERLLDDRDEAVRAAAARAVARTGLRHAKILAHLRDAVRRRAGDERLALLLALGHLGDARDMDVLLGALLAADADVVRYARLALVALTHVTLPPTHARWSRWWSTARERLERELGEALRTLEADPDGSAAEAAYAAVSAGAWVQLPAVQAQVAGWLGASDRNLRRHAVRLVADLGLLDAREGLERLARLEHMPPTLQVALDRALDALGRLPAEPADDPPASAER